MTWYFSITEHPDSTLRISDFPTWANASRTATETFQRDGYNMQVLEEPNADAITTASSFNVGTPREALKFLKDILREMPRMADMFGDENWDNFHNKFEVDCGIDMIPKTGQPAMIKATIVQGREEMGIVFEDGKEMPKDNFGYLPRVFMQAPTARHLQEMIDAWLEEDADMAEEKLNAVPAAFEKETRLIAAHHIKGKEGSPTLFDGPSQGPQNRKRSTISRS
jgi:hypothetical protein